MTQSIQIHSYQLGPMKNIGYILKDTKTNDCAIVDPAWDANFILNQIDALKGRVAMILLTHTHFDHLNALDDVLCHISCLVVVSSHASPLSDHSVKYKAINDGDELWLGATNIIALETPGHSQCGVCYYVKPHLVVGDTLFIDGCGRADLDGSDPNALYESLVKLQALPDDTLIYPGHDYGPRKVDQLSNQRKTNPFLNCNKSDFLRKRMGTR